MTIDYQFEPKSVEAFLDVLVRATLAARRPADYARLAGSPGARQDGPHAGLVPHDSRRGTPRRAEPEPLR